MLRGWIFHEMVLFVNFLKQPTHQRPLKSSEPGNYNGRNEIIKQPPAFKKPRAVNSGQSERHPESQAVSTGKEVA